MKNILIAVSLSFLFGCAGGAKEAATGLEKVLLKDLNGKVIDYKSLEGKVVFLNFWATWCGPCVKEMPSIKSAQERLKDQAIVFLFASSEEASVINKFENKRGFQFNYVQLDMTPEALNIYSLPTTYIFNKVGELVVNESGTRVWDSEKNLNDLKTIIENDKI